MKLTIDLAQSPIALRDELTQAVRIALGAKFYIEESDEENFTADEVLSADTLAGTLPNLPGVGALPAGASALPGVSVGALPAGVVTDKNGHPWDIRIHSTGKSTIADGSWKLKKGVDKALVAQINAQNLQLLNTAIPSTAPAAGATLPTLPTATALPTLPTATALPTLPPVAAVVAPDVDIVVTDYPSFAQFIGQQVAAHGDKATNQLNIGLTHYGLVDANGAPQLSLVAHKPEVIDPLHKWLKVVIGA